MSSIRLYILDALARRGDMHGHQLRLLAEQEHVHLWTDISVGALYGALKRLAAEGLLAEVRTEREGSYPERQVYGITDAGRGSSPGCTGRAWRGLFRPDPFDLALSRPDPDRLDELRDALGTGWPRCTRCSPRPSGRTSGPGRTSPSARRTPCSTASTGSAPRSRWHDDLVAALPDIVADERFRAPTPDPLAHRAARRPNDHPHDPKDTTDD